MKDTVQSKYLVESTLGICLTHIFVGKEFIRNKLVPNSGINARVDYRNDELNLIVEFDGYWHYSDAKVIIADERKDNIYSKMGFNIVRIPYFVQISESVIKNLFSIEIKNYKQIYSHGFIDRKALLPADYCELGIKRFLLDLVRFSYLKEDIINSLKDKINKLGDKRLVLPESLFNLL